MKKRSLIRVLALLGFSFNAVNLNAQEAVIYLDTTHQVIQGFGAA